MSPSEPLFLLLSIIIGNKKFEIQLYENGDIFHFSIVCMPHLNSNIPSNIYYPSIGAKILQFSRTTSDISTFVTFSNCLLKTMQKQGSKNRPMLNIIYVGSIIIYMFNNNMFFGKQFTVFKLFKNTEQPLLNFFHCVELELCITQNYTFACSILCFGYLLFFLLICLFFCLFVCLFACLFVRLSC